MHGLVDAVARPVRSCSGAASTAPACPVGRVRCRVRSCRCRARRRTAASSSDACASGGRAVQGPPTGRGDAGPTGRAPRPVCRARLRLPDAPRPLRRGAGAGRRGRPCHAFPGGRMARMLREAGPQAQPASRAASSRCPPGVMAGRRARGGGLDGRTPVEHRAQASRRPGGGGACLTAGPAEAGPGRGCEARVPCAPSAPLRCPGACAPPARRHPNRSLSPPGGRGHGFDTSSGAGSTGSGIVTGPPKTAPPCGTGTPRTVSAKAL